jgi:nucleoside-diphosphate-sugar epimerase
MRVLVTGVKGQLGHDVMDELAAKGIEGIGVDVEEMDITDAAACEKVITEAKPDAVIHCAAYTAVDAAEENVELCRKVNAEGTRNIAKVCKALDIKMMYISTDYVFNGEGLRPWEPDDHREPLNVYGLTKYEGEIAVEQNLEKGLNSDVGNAGASLSGGQRQKIGIARALLSKAEYMIFDEATSSVDPESEKEIWETIGHLAHTRTLIIISHRMSSVRGADCIYVLKDGRVAQQGDHETLMAQDGLYHELVIRQQAMEVAE